MRSSKSRREAGFTVVEAAASGLMVAVSICGLVVSVCYGRQLEKTTQTSWRAAAAATATLERIRSASGRDWQNLPLAWDGATCAETSFSDPIVGKLATAVASDETALDSPTGMWTTGASAPNFYFVEVTPTTTAATALSKSLVFQTYVANRSALNVTTFDSMAGTGALISSTTVTSTTTSASKLSTTGATGTLSGTNNNTMTLKLNNSSSSSIGLTTLKVTTPTTAKMVYVSVNGVAIYDKPTNASNAITVTTTGLLSGGLPPGPVTIQIRTATASLAGNNESYTFTFSDKSTRTVTVTP